MLPGPTLRLQPGDTLRLKLINDLPPNRDTTPLNTDQPHKLNTTNFHFHGSHVSPSGISDNILRQMHPGQSYDVQIALPADHTRGTYWYHPHHHGGADIQMASGMAGAIVVEGDFAEVEEIAAAQERMLVLNEVVFDAQRTIESFESLWSEVATRFVSVNGQREPIIRLRPGEVQRWRIVHTGYQNDLLLGLNGHQLHAIAYDGISLAALDSLDALLMAPGQRADILVQAGAPGAYELRALPTTRATLRPAAP
jgi:FtsP/CotA-like multicopper oxidase with cupredoxin domain